MEQREISIALAGGNRASVTYPAWLRSVAGVVVACLAVGLASQVRVPVPGTDVPYTLQSLAVLLVGLTLRPGRAVAAMGLYLGVGLCGLPVFAAGSLGVLGPTGGYLVGFVGAAAVVSAVSGTGEAGRARLVFAGLVGMLVVFGAGVGWRVVWFGGDLGVALVTGLVPFVVKAVLEVVLAASAVAMFRDFRRARPL